MKNEGELIVLSGFSGTGKGTIVKEVLKRYPEEYVLSVSATTRAPRPGEQDGREYFFCSDEQFRDMIRNNELLEYAGYVDHYYGTPRRYVSRHLSAGKNVILEIECKGAMQIREAMPEALLIYVLPPSVPELERRLRTRGTEEESVILKRLKKASEETEYISRFDYVIVNDKLDDAVDVFTAIIKAERSKTQKNTDLIIKIGEELANYAG